MGLRISETHGSLEPALRFKVKGVRFRGIGFAFCVKVGPVVCSVAGSRGSRATRRRPLGVLGFAKYKQPGHFSGKACHGFYERPEHGAARNLGASRKTLKNQNPQSRPQTRHTKTKSHKA